ncbi:MAG TPA: ABC transporter ATP-binding protein [Candidatus Limnocylindrales bacterium]|nr:ABC transporter ATP-binding protein [Candidatus Limnocylindrales bacterium]
MLEARAVSLDYATGDTVAHAVDTVSLQVPPGSFLGLIGPSGSGKSSLMYLLSGLKQPSRGAIGFEGREFARLSAGALMRLRRTRFGFVFQQHFLINYLTVLENTLVGAVQPTPDAVRRALALLDRVGLRDRAAARPYQLSIGQRQRVAVARALVHQPSLIFADEPTAALDQATGQQVIALLADYRREMGSSVVVVTHDPDMLVGADRVFHMRDGRLN